MINRKADRESVRLEAEFRNSDHPVRVDHETEKAVGVDVVLEVPGGYQDTVTVWFPKSMIGGGNGVAMIPGWMIRDREAKAPDEYRVARSGRERHRWMKGESAALFRGVEILEMENAK